MSDRTSFDHSASTAVLLVALLSACQAFEPTLKSLAVPPARGGPTPPALVDAPPAHVDVEPENPAQAPRPRPHIGSDEKIQLELRGIPLANAIHTIAETAGINMYLDAQLDAKIDASFKGVTLDDALHAILDRNGLVLVEDPPGIYYVKLADGSEIDERRFMLRSARVADVETNLKGLLAGNTATQLALDKEQNFVLVRGRRSDVDLVAQYLEAADRLKHQVLIEVRIVEVTLGTQFELGLSHALSNVDINGNTLALMQQFATPDTSFKLTFDSEDGDLTSTLQALERYAGVDLLASPRVVAVNNTEASIEIVREVPYIKTTTAVTSGTTGGVGTSSTQEVAFKEAGIKLKVKPEIREGGVIELDVTQELSEVADFLNGIPALDKRNLVSKFQVRDRNTLVIGGLMQNRKGKTDSGIPGLMDIPWLGRLFKSDQDRVDKRELVLFVTPRIIALDEAQGLSDSYREVFRERKAEMGLDENAQKKQP